MATDESSLRQMMRTPASEAPLASDTRSCTTSPISITGSGGVITSSGTGVVSTSVLAPDRS